MLSESAWPGWLQTDFRAAQPLLPWPFTFLIVLAALLSLDKELYEAAAIDGASPWGTFWRISLPIIRPVLLVVVIFRTMDILNIVAIVLAVTFGGPNFATETYTFHICIEGFSIVSESM